MTPKPIPTQDLVPALRAFAVAPESGLSPAQRAYVEALADAVASQPYLDAGAVPGLSVAACRAGDFALVRHAAAHTLEALAVATMPPDFARAALRLYREEQPEAEASEHPSALERLADAAELWALTQCPPQAIGARTREPTRDEDEAGDRAWWAALARVQKNATR